jgi:hypothetical protein
VLRVTRASSLELISNSRALPSAARAIDARRESFRPTIDIALYRVR